MAETTKAPEKKPIDRVIRVFVSSTFADMQAEREELVKRVFPELRRRCDSRGVVWSEVDLRWGVTDEQKAEGKVLPICLAEIQKCRPYFIGLLGERYGWVPDAIDPGLVESEPWLRSQAGRSVTELEILHGVLNDPAMAEHSFFYFRDPAYLATLPADQRAKFVDDTAVAKTKLLALKEQIRHASLDGKLKYAPRENYADPKALAELVRKDLGEVIDRLFPEGSESDTLTREAAGHEAWARSRQRVYVAREAYFRRLDEHAAGDGPPLVVLGESGSGKTALLANWVKRLRERTDAPFVIQHYIGASSGSTDWMAMLRRILGELDRHFGLKLEIPDQPAGLRMAFANGLYRAAAAGRAAIVLDGLNQLEDHDQALDLAWLPPEVPGNLRLVLSTLAGRPLDELQRRGWPSMNVELLSAEDRQALIPKYLEQYGKTLAPAPTEAVAQAEETRNPLYLRVLLEELRLWGQHDSLLQRIAYYLEAQTLPELFEKVFIRWEKDYEGETDLVGDVLSFLACSRRGLSDAELMDLLGTGADPIPRIMLSPLLLAAGDSLVDRSGLLGLSHDFARQAVDEAYLPNDDTRRAFHRRIADYFASQPLGRRKVDELPWQLARAQEWQRLADLLAEPEFFEAAWEANQFEVKAYWVQIEAGASVRMVQAYQWAISGEETGRDFVWDVGRLLGDTGHPDEALVIRQRLAEQDRVSGNLDGLQAHLGNQAVILYARGQPDQAMALYKDQERICRQLGNLDSLSGSLGNQALILKARGQLDQAMALHKEQERICRQLGNLDSLSGSLGNQALILSARGQLDQAMALHKEQERICRQLGNPDSLQICLGNQASILYARGQLDQAMALYKEQERISRQLGNLDSLSRSLGNQALILSARGQLDQAMALHKERERICRQLGNLDSLSGSLGNQAGILSARGQLDEAMALHKEQERICRQLANPDSLQICLGNQALILSARGQLDQAMALHKEQERICRQLGNLNGLQAGLGNQALILYARGQLDQAMALHKEQERICRQLGNLDSLQICLGNQANILYARGQLDQAMALHKDKERICRQLGNLNSLQAGLGNQALILSARGQLDQAMALHEEQERICRRLGNPSGLATSLVNQADIQSQRNEFREAIALAEQALETAQSHGLTALAQQIEPILARIRSQAAGQPQ
jgi:tetratricopeptide (TPR) repeat protein